MRTPTLRSSARASCSISGNRGRGRSGAPIAASSARRRSGSRTARTASARPTPGCAPGRRRSWPVGAAELLDDHRLAIVGRANQQQVGHALLGLATHKGLPAGSAPRLRADSRSSGRREGAGCARPPEDGPSPGPPGRLDKVDDGIFVHGYHSSIWSNGLAGRQVVCPAGRQYPYPAERACPAELMS